MAPIHLEPMRNMYMLPYHHIQELVYISILHLPSSNSISKCRFSYDPRLTCLVLHFQPFFPSCGQWFPNVAFLASVILLLAGYSWLNSSSCCSIDATIAHPQSGECLRCSASGSSSSSQPSRDLWHKKQATLSGLAWVGWKKNPALASFTWVSFHARRSET